MVYDLAHYFYNFFINRNHSLKNSCLFWQYVSKYLMSKNVAKQKYQHFIVNGKVHEQEMIRQSSLVINICCGFINNDYFVSFQ